MLGAILTTFFFALSGVTGQRVAVRLGSMWGNFIRLLLAAVVLGILVALFYRDSISSETFGWFFFSGIVGFGIGDIALFAAYERIGSRLTILLNLCFAPLFAMAMEYLWLGNAVTGRVVFLASLILIGVIMAIRPGAKSRQIIERRGLYGAGVVAAIVAGFGQGIGAVLSRKAEEVATIAGVEVGGISAAFQRVFAGVVIAGIVVLLVRFFGSKRLWKDWRTPLNKSLAPWLIGAALFGPVIGVSFFQWALKSQESGIVLAVVATTPIVMMPLSAITEGDRPSLLSIFGAIIAVAGVVLLNVWV